MLILKVALDWFKQRVSKQQRVMTFVCVAATASAESVLAGDCRIQFGRPSIVGRKIAVP